MATQLNKVIAHLQHVLRPPDGGLSDAQLLTRFVAARDEVSFAALVRRHGPMVWRVCLRVLGQVQDAEDSFQATFLVLACKAASVAKRESVGSFLYGVAYRTALDARAVAARRRKRERQVQEMPHPESAPEEPTDWRPWLDYELNRLAEKYRAAILLCDLEGRSRKEAARQLKIPEGTLSSRLATGRRLLAQALARRGVALSIAALVGALSEGVSMATPTPLVSATLKAAVLAASGQMAVSASVAVLTKGAMKAMLLTKLKSTLAILLVVTSLGASVLVYRASGQSSAPGGKQSLSEVEKLRRENELLKLNLEIVLDKVRAQETELKNIREHAKAADNWSVPSAKAPTAFQPNFPIMEKQLANPTLIERYVPLKESKVAPEALYKQPNQEARKRADEALRGVYDNQRKNTRVELLRAVDEALKKLPAAQDADSVNRALKEVDQAWKKLQEQLKKQGIANDFGVPVTKPGNQPGLGIEDKKPR